MQKEQKQKMEDGFTLVEVMVTLVIIGLLTTFVVINVLPCLLYTSPSPRDATLSRMPSSA